MTMRSTPLLPRVSIWVLAQPPARFLTARDGEKLSYRYYPGKAGNGVGDGKSCHISLRITTKVIRSDDAQYRVYGPGARQAARSTVRAMISAATLAIDSSSFIEGIP